MAVCSSSAGLWVRKMVTVAVDVDPLQAPYASPAPIPSAAARTTGNHHRRRAPVTSRRVVSSGPLGPQALDPGSGPQSAVMPRHRLTASFPDLDPWCPPT